MFQPAIARCSQSAVLPDAARRYLAHAITPDAPEALAANISMHGEIKLNGRWRPFQACEWLAPACGLEWRASIHWGPVRLCGYDRLIDGHGEMLWRLSDVLTVIHEEGVNIARSTAGRAALEAVWLPTWLGSPAVVWTENADGTVRAHWRVGEETVAVDLVVDPAGRPRTAHMLRWGDPDGRGWRPVTFGARIEEEHHIAGLNVPTRISAGWWFGEDRFEREGIFFRAVVDDLEPIYPS